MKRVSMPAHWCRTLRLLVSIMMVLTMSVECALAAGAPADSTGSERGDGLPDATFTVFIPDPSYIVSPDDAPVMQQIYEETGVRFEMIVPPAEPLEQLTLMLATGEMTDLILFTDTNVMRQFIEAGKLVRLNDLLEENCPQLMSVNLAEIKNTLRGENGDIYYMPTAYHLGDEAGYQPEPYYAFNMRSAYFDEVGYDRVPNTLTAYKTLLGDIKERYPDMAPVSIALGPQGDLAALPALGASVYGLAENGGLVLDKGQEGDRLIHYSQSPEIKEFFRFLNGLNLEGYLDIESPVLSGTQLVEKAVARKVWSTIGGCWDIYMAVNAYEEGEGTQDQIFFGCPRADESVEQVTYTRGILNLFTTGMAITTACEDPARYLKFYEYANTEEGRLKILGTVDWDFTGENTVEATEGVNFIVRQDKEIIPGRPVVEFSAWTSEMWGVDENWWINWGVERMYDFTYRTGNYPNGKYDIIGDEDVGMWWSENQTRINNAMGWTGLNYFQKNRDMFVNCASFAGLELDPSGNEYAMLLAVNRVQERMLPRVIMADSAEAFETEWKNMLNEFKQEGLDTLMAKYNELYKRRMEVWGN